MSKSTISGASATLIGLAVLAITAYPAFAQYSTNPAVRPMPPIRQETTGSGAARNQLIPQRIDIKKENTDNIIASMREKLASRTAALKARLQTFRDQRKATIAERVNTNLNNINQNHTAQMQKLLDVMSSILNKLEARVNVPTPDIKNPTAAKIAIASARATIASASAAVSAQALKDYTIQVTTEGRIGIDAKTQRDKLHTDLLALRKIVIDAKQAVANAIRVAKSGPVPSGTGLPKEGTTSGRQ